jgi:hypothetical protein
MLHNIIALEHNKQALKKKSFRLETSQVINKDVKEITTKLFKGKNEIGYVTYTLSLNNRCNCPKKSRGVIGSLFTSNETSMLHTCDRLCPCRDKNGQCTCSLPKGKITVLDIKQKDHKNEGEKVLLDHASTTLCNHGCTKESIIVVSTNPVEKQK